MNQRGKQTSKCTQSATQFPRLTCSTRCRPRSFWNDIRNPSEGKAGEAFAVDATLFHRAGRNLSSDERPIIAIKYALAPFKQQVDYCESAKEHLERTGPTAAGLERPGLARLMRSSESAVPGENGSLANTTWRTRM